MRCSSGCTQQIDDRKVERPGARVRQAEAFGAFSGGLTKGNITPYGRSGKGAHGAVPEQTARIASAY